MFTCPAVDGGIPKEPMLREADSNGAGDEIPSETYADVLSQHLRSLQVVLLQHHATELGRLRDQNDKLQRQLASAQTRLRGVDEDPQPRVISMPALPGYPALEREESAASGQVSKLVSNSSLAVDIATSDLKQCERWQTLTAKLIEAAGCMTAFDAPAPKPRSTAGIMCELKMRPSWSHSLVQTKATYQRSRSHIAALREMSSTFKINDAFTDTSFLQRFVVGPHSRHQLVWAIIASVFIIWDLITIPLEMFNVAEFIRVLDIVGVTSLTFWAMDIPLHLVFGVQLRGSLEMRPSKLWSLYVRSWLAVDLLIVLLDVALILLERMSSGQSNGAFRSARFLRSLRLLRLFRLVRVAKLQRELSLVASRFLSTYAFMVMKIVGALLMMLAINHIIGCCWFGIGSGTDSDNTWIHRIGIEDADFGTSYVCSIHWALTQFTPSTNNIAPENGIERFFAIWVILLAMGVYSSFIGSISSTVNSLRAVRGEKIKQHSRLQVLPVVVAHLQDSNP
ncbi:HCN2, partial [Symbiodinium microadriaticum]